MGRVFDMNLDVKFSNQSPHLSPGYVWMPEIVSKCHANVTVCMPFLKHV